MTSIDDFAVRKGRKVTSASQPTPPGAGTPEERLRHPSLLVPVLVFLGMLIAVVSSLGAPLIPTIAQADGVSLSTAQWILTAALLTGALATPIMGRLADGPRQRDVIVTTLVIVLAGCVLAAVADDFIMLVIGRALQGVGLGLLPVNMAIARRNLPRQKAVRTIATLSVSTAVGVGLGYPLTGLIAQVFDFHAAYWFGAIVVVLALAASVVVLPPRNDDPARPFDLLGTVSLSVAVVGVSVVLSEGGGWGWTSARSLGIIVGCVLLLAVWIRHELRFDFPLVDLRHLRNRSVLTADVAGFLMCVAMYLFLPIIVVFVQVPTQNGFGFGASVVVSGLVLVPLSVGTFAASRFLVSYERRFGTRSMIPLGALVFACAGIFFALEHADLWEAFVASGIAGLGVGFTFAAMPGFIIRAVPHHETGSATGFYQVLRNIGLSVGSALSAAVLSAFTHHGQPLPEVGGFRVALVISAALGVATAVVSFLLPERVDATGQPPDPVERDALEREMKAEAELAGVGVMLTDEHEPLEIGRETT